MTVDFTFAIRSDEESMTEEGYNETVPLAQPIAVACGKLVKDTLKVILCRLFLNITLQHQL